jgi:hypothetical protein
MTDARRPGAPRRRRRAGAAAAVLIGLLAGCGGSGSGGGPGTVATAPAGGLPASTTGERFGLAADVDLLATGDGARRVYVAQAGQRRRGAPVVLFWHGYGSATISGYEPWIAHLARQGATVVFPAWETPGHEDTAELREAFDVSTAAIGAALDALPGHGPVIAAGVSAGGELAVDYAVAAPREKRLPAPVAVFALYPGRGLPGGPVLLPPQKGTLPKATRLVAVASPYDRSAGTRWARAIVRNARAIPPARKKLILVTDRALGDHLAPGRSTPQAQRTFWGPLDALLAHARAT